MNYLRWHYRTSPKFILELMGNYLFFVGHLFSVKLLLRTLFSPWRKLTAQKEKHGISGALDEISFNLISRTLGFIVRLATLLTSFIFFALIFVVGVLIFAFWFLIPVFSLPIYLRSQRKDNPKEKEEFIKSHLEDISDQDNSAHVSDWYIRIKKEDERKKQFWTKENLSGVPGIGRNWAYGYTILLDKLTFDLAKDKLPLERFVGRKEQIDQLQIELSKEEDNNIFLVGEPGVGRKTITIGLAKLIFAGKCLDNLLFKRVLLLDVHQIVSKTQAETEANMTTLLKEAKKAGNVILVIPSIEEFINDSKVNLSDIFYQHLQEGGLQLIGITDPTSYQKYVLRNPKLLKIFDKVNVSQISKDDALIILENLTGDLEKKYKVVVTFEAMNEIIEKSEDLITEIPFPEKAIDLLEEALVFAKSQNKERLEKADIDEVISQKTNLPVGELTNLEKIKLVDLEKILHQRVIGQDLAISKISQALRRKRAGVGIKDSSIGTFLFVGPTGVGKTETAKALAQVYFGDENKMIRLDMSEFQSDGDIGKLIGDVQNTGILTSQIRQTPFTVLLLDEFEKASPKIINIFLTIFDEGYLTDGQGKKVSFKNTVIIATSNAGSEFIREKILANTQNQVLEKELTDYLLKEKIFTPELLNRFDAIVFYKPLTQGEIEQVANLMLEKLNKKLKDEKGITVKVSPESIKKLIEKGYDPVFGARSLQRVIQEEVEDKVAQKLLSENLQKGSVIEV